MSLINNFKHSNLISALAITAGILLILAGTAAIGYYILVIVEALENVDKSGLFWMLPFAFIGIFLIFLGSYFLIIGVKARSDKKYRRAAFLSVIALGTCTFLLLAGLIASEFAANNTRAELIRQEALIQELQRITGLSIIEADKKGITVSATTDGVHSGNYQVQLSVYNSRARFWESNFKMELNQNGNQFTRYISFDEIFSKCSEEFKNNSSVYVCVNNAGTRNSEFSLSAYLTADDFDSNELSDSFTETRFYLDTITENDTVNVQKVVFE